MFEIRDQKWDTEKKTYIMGILNVTPDSFSDGGAYTSVESAVAQAEQMMREGAALIDVGGESTRPGYREISVDEECERVVPVIRAIRERLPVPISVDTYKYDVAKEAIAAGADMLNSIWGFVRDERLAKLVAQTDTSVCLMDNRDEIAETDPEQFLTVVKNELGRSLETAEKYGIRKEKIMLDPGVGFGKTYEQNLAVIRDIGVLTETGCPILLAVSRKSVIGLTLDLPVEEREEGTIALSVYASMKGCAAVRVHDVEKNARALRMLEAVTKG